MNRNKLSLAISLSLIGVAQTPLLYAQQSANTDQEVEEVIVTGVGAIARSSFDTPASVNSFDEEDITRLAASSNADLLRNVPGISAEGGGGEVAVNLFVPGLPASGQYAYNPLNFDGFTTFSYFGLNSSAFDVYHRTDLGVERVEFIRGGASNLFGPGSVAGIVNYISKQGKDEAESKVQLEVAQDNRVATNFANSGPVGNGEGNNYYALSGYYRYDEGPIDTGLETDGFQLKGNFRHEFDDGSGSFTIFAQAIDDKVQFYLPLPLDADSNEFARGNDGNEVQTIQTDQLDNFVYPTANGLRELRLGDGVETKGGSLAFELNKEYDSGWSLGIKSKYSKYTHNFNLFIPAGGDNVLTTQAFLQQQGLDGYDNASFAVLDTGEQLSDTDLVYRTQGWDRIRPAQDYTSQFDISKSFDTGGVTHTFTGGLWLSRAQADDFNHRLFYLGEFNNRPRLLTLSVSGDNSATPGVIETGTRHYSVNGFAGSGGHVNAGGSANRIATYFADQIEGDRWSLDLGIRLEQFDAEYFSEGSTSAAIDPSLYAIPDGDSVLPNLQTDTVGNGRFTRLDVDGTAWAAAVAGLYRINDSLNVFGNISRGFFWPQARTLPGRVNSLSSLADPVSFVEDQFEEETIDRAEIGLKFSSGIFDGSIGAYYLTLSDNTTFQQLENADGTFTAVTVISDTETTGIDASGTFSFNDYLDLDVNLTFADHEFSEGPNEGNEISRQPNILGGFSLIFNNDTIDSSITYSYRGDSFGNDANTRELESFGFWRADAGYTIAMADDEELRLSLSVFNLTDEDGLTEGNPRAGTGPQGDFAVGRPILPRRITFRATYSF